MEKEAYRGLLHDTKSSLSGSMGLIEIVIENLAEKKGEQNENLECLKMAHEGLKKLIQIFEQTLRSSPEDGFKEIKKSKFNLSFFLKDIVSVFEFEFRDSKIKFIRQTLPSNNQADKQDFFIWGDKNLIHRAVVNLLRNAVEEITKNYPETERQIIINYGNSEKSTIIQVQNQTQIKDEDMKKLFTERFSTKTNGHGLGTKMIQAVAQAHGGDVFVLKKGKNLTLGIKIPNQ